MNKIIPKALAIIIVCVIALLVPNNNILFGKEKTIANNSKTFEISDNNMHFYDINKIHDKQKVLITGIIDGDTLLAQDFSKKEIQIRLLGINADEVTTFHNNEQCLGTEATAFMALLLKRGRYAYLETDKTNRDEDDFGRKLRYVYVKNPLSNDNSYIDLSESMIAMGYAKVMRQYPSLKKELYIKTEEITKDKRKILREQCIN